ncbi:uncharacterized protein KY384_006985 [Bacidia gigantensis]|uniref:uncharacterized protein n=1 Tax=Bacidia gigantensis TaxID=2732470 RepID=UPI001D057F6A|nr:uncharacterized protein KY384_006985 [Bacidia gigantensis]KAG8528069.1 hypothetical protein KY384_006985 [Bacidia gigantensis]
MSHYLSSFIIDPVVRQARRFSRPSIGANSGFEDGADLVPASSATDQVRASIGVSSSERDQQTFESNAEVVDDLEHEISAALVDDASFRLVEVGNLEPAVHARQYTVQQAVPQIYGPGNGSSIAAVHDPSSVDGSSELTLPARTRDAESDARETPLNDSSLPEDDGMSQMRRQILAIQRADTSSESKARLVYGLMTEKHNTSHQSLHARAHSPASLQSSDHPLTPTSPRSWASLRPTISPPTSSSSAGDSSNPFNLTPETLQPTYWQKRSASNKDSNADRQPSSSEEEERPYGCAHYKRNIKLQCSACNRWYTCRFCHDQVEDHMLNRRETKMMLCMFCWGAQPASNACIFCDQVASWYYCDVCKLWDDDVEKDIYHCNDCGICRVGKGIGKDFFHCKRAYEDVISLPNMQPLDSKYGASVSCLEKDD